MSSNSVRAQLGKHLTLVEDRHLHYISQIQGHAIPAFAAWYEVSEEALSLVDEGKLPPELRKQALDLKAYLDDMLRLSVSVGARGRQDLAEVLRALEEAQIHRDAGQFVAQPQQEQRRGGLRG